MPDRLRVGYEFEFEADGDTPAYRDTLWFDSIAEYQKADVNSLKQDRYDNWRAVLAAPQPEVVPEPVDVLGVAQQAMDAAQQAMDVARSVIDAREPAVADGG